MEMLELLEAEGLKRFDRLLAARAGVALNDYLFPLF